MKVQRVEKHNIRPTHPYYSMLDEFCFKSKNLYNFANYQIRQKFCETGEFINYNTMDKLLKQKDMEFDYRNMSIAESAQQCLRLLEKNWKSFFASAKDYKKNQSKYTGRPKLPKYLDKNGRNILILTNRGCKVRDSMIVFPKVFNGFTLKTKVNSLQQVRILPRNKHIIVEVVYNYESKDSLEDNRRYLGVDIGLDNLATIVNNVGYSPIIINGKGLKSINKYYNKQISHYREVAKRMNKLDYTERMNKLTIKRNNKIDDFMHKASKFIVDYALGINCNTIIIGNNKDWKRGSKMSKNVNQSFVGIPHQRFIEMIKYKCENVGLNLIITEESYTSSTSFLDGELPCKDNYDKTRRKYRGLFISNEGIKINADVNGAYQIIKKVSPNLFDGVEGVGLHPFKVNIK
ncbi:transposase [bacterium]|nr:transposase [bacterium]